jgi:hypothetical protein
MSFQVKVTQGEEEENEVGQDTVNENVDLSFDVVEKVSFYSTVKP